MGAGSPFPVKIPGLAQYFHRWQDLFGRKSYRPPAHCLKLNPVVLHAVHPGVFSMNPAEEQQMLNSLTVMSQDIKTLVSLVKDLTLQQEAADQKALSQLVNIAHKR
jgi:hypothetical protein